MATSVADRETDSTAIARRPLEAAHCALVVVDIQEKLLPPIYEKERMVHNSALLLRVAKVLEIPVVATTQYSKGLGKIVPEIAALVAETPQLDKMEFGCFGSGAFCDAVKALPGTRNTLLLCGMEAHICVMQTALGGLNRGYIVHVAADAVSSRTKLNWRLGLRRMEAAGAVISSTEMMMYELLRVSGTPQFKQMLQYIR